MSKTRYILPIFALMLCLGAFLFPVTAFAQTNEDTTPPTVTTTLTGDTLTVVAKDSGSGVAAIYVNEHRFATLVNGTATVPIKEYAGAAEKVTVYATDIAGNRSESVLINNPYYQAPASTPAPTTSSSTPTAAPSSSAAPSSTATPSTSTPASSASDSSSSDGDVSEDADTDETESAISEGSTVVTPGGTGQVTEIATDEDGKLFYTIETPAGNVFYLVIDMARTDGNNVYFLNAVTEDDLMALAETDGSTTGGVSAIPSTDTEPTSTPEPADSEQEAEEEPVAASGSNTGAIIFVILAVLAVGGAAYYFKILKPKQQAAQQDEEEYEDEELDEASADEDYLFSDEFDGYEVEESDTKD